MFLITENGRHQLRLDAIRSLHVMASYGADKNIWRLCADAGSGETVVLSEHKSEDSAREWMRVLGRAIQDRVKSGLWIDLSEAGQDVKLMRVYGERK